QIDEEGCIVDFHSLRVTFITRMARAGVPMATAQRLARHSTPLLTFNVYTRLGSQDEQMAIASLPALPSPIRSGEEEVSLAEESVVNDVETETTATQNRAKSTTPKSGS